MSNDYATPQEYFEKIIIPQFYVAYDGYNEKRFAKFMAGSPIGAAGIVGGVGIAAALAAGPLSFLVLGASVLTGGGAWRALYKKMDGTYFASIVKMYGEKESNEWYVRSKQMVFKSLGTRQASEREKDVIYGHLKHISERIGDEHMPFFNEVQIIDNLNPGWFAIPGTLILTKGLLQHDWLPVVLVLATSQMMSGFIDVIYFNILYRANLRWRDEDNQIYEWNEFNDDCLTEPIFIDQFGSGAKVREARTLIKEYATHTLFVADQIVCEYYKMDGELVEYFDILTQLDGANIGYESCLPRYETRIDFVQYPTKFLELTQKSRHLLPAPRD